MTADEKQARAYARALTDAQAATRALSEALQHIQWVERERLGTALVAATRLHDARHFASEAVDLLRVCCASANARVLDIEAARARAAQEVGA